MDARSEFMDTESINDNTLPNKDPEERPGSTYPFNTSSRDKTDETGVINIHINWEAFSWALNEKPQVACSDAFEPTKINDHIIYIGRDGSLWSVDGKRVLFNNIEYICYMTRISRRRHYSVCEYYDKICPVPALIPKDSATKYIKWFLTLFHNTVKMVDANNVDVMRVNDDDVINVIHNIKDHLNTCCMSQLNVHNHLQSKDIFQDILSQMPGLNADEITGNQDKLPFDINSTIGTILGTVLNECTVDMIKDKMSLLQTKTIHLNATSNLNELLNVYMEFITSYLNFDPSIISYINSSYVSIILLYTLKLFTDFDSKLPSDSLVCSSEQCLHNILSLGMDLITMKLDNELFIKNLSRTKDYNEYTKMLMTNFYRKYGPLKDAINEEALARIIKTNYTDIAPLEQDKEFKFMLPNILYYTFPDKERVMSMLQHYIDNYKSVDVGSSGMGILKPSMLALLSPGEIWKALTKTIEGNKTHPSFYKTEEVLKVFVEMYKKYISLKDRTV